MPKTAGVQKRADGFYVKNITTGRNTDGKPIRKYFYAKTIKELNERVSEFERQMRLGLVSTNEAATFGEIAEIWIRDFKAHVGDKMRLRYQGILNNQLAELKK